VNDDDELPTVHCPACGGHTLRPSDSLPEEIERRVFGDAERWACACGYIEDRPAPTDMIP
jgi:hypothetical protein